MLSTPGQMAKGTLEEARVLTGMLNETGRFNEGQFGLWNKSL
jgi:hypothetical protein